MVKNETNTYTNSFKKTKLIKTFYCLRQESAILLTEVKKYSWESHSYDIKIFIEGWINGLKLYLALAAAKKDKMIPKVFGLETILNDVRWAVFALAMRLYLPPDGSTSPKYKLLCF